MALATIAIACSVREGDASCPHDWMGPEDDWEQYQYSSPLVPTTSPPQEPPKVQMVVGSESQQSLEDGVLYLADWITQDSHLTLVPNPSEVAPWPESVVDGSPCHVKILTDVLPVSVVIAGFQADDLLDTGHPREAYGWTLLYECGRFGDRPCVKQSDDGTVEIHPIPAPLLKLPYLAVSLSWGGSPTGQAYGDREGVSATWLFRFSGG